MFLGQKRQAEEQVCWPWTEQSYCSRSLCGQSPWTPQPHTAHGAGWGSEQAHVHSPRWPHARTSCTVTSKLEPLPLTLGERHSLETGRKKERMRVKIHRFWKGDGATSEALCHLSPGEDATRLSPSQKQAVLKKLPSSRMPRTGISKDLRKSFQAFSWKVDAILSKGQLLLSGTTVILYLFQRKSEFLRHPH